MANTVRSGSSQVDVVWRPSGLSHTAWPDLMAGPLTSKPLVLLVNSNTASASEVLAGKQPEMAVAWSRQANCAVEMLSLQSCVCLLSFLRSCAPCCIALAFLTGSCSWSTPPASQPACMCLQNTHAVWCCCASLCMCAGALQDHKRAVMIGEKTFGKGVVQYFFPLGDGSGLKLTVAKYLTPNMYDISKHGGLTPDIYCKDYPRGERGLGRAGCTPF